MSSSHPFFGDYLRFEDPAFRDADIPMDPAEVARFCWTLASVHAYLRSHVAYVKGSNAYIVKMYDMDIQRYRHELRTHREVATLLAKFRFPLPLDQRGLPSKDYKATEFLDGRDILVYERVVFVPFSPKSSALHVQQTVHRFFNMFMGFRFHGAPAFLHPGDPAPFFDHLKYVLCAGDDIVYRYVVQWLAHMFQHPSVKPGTALVMVSEPGAGKNIFFDIVKDVMGSIHYMLVNKAERVVAKFNAHLATRFLVVLDEARFDSRSAGDSAAVMKSLITQTDTVMEKKFADAVAVKSYERYVLLSNDRVPIRIDPGDRRYCCLQVASARIGDMELIFLVSTSIL